MTDFDNDLQSIQQARTLATQARDAQRLFMKATQAEVDRICAAMAQAAADASVQLGKMASEETGYGVPEHKTLKNLLSSQLLWEAIKDIPTVGVIRSDPAKRTYDIAWPMGVVCALTPSTNPTSTTMFKTLIAVKAKNGIVIAPHPFAAKCCGETIRVMAEAGERAGMPKGLISCMTRVTLPGTQELMKHKYMALILATGGSDMVRAAHSVGKPAYGVGPGNVPAYVDRSADVAKAAKYIVASKAFDHSVICATEQAVVADRPIAAQLEELMKAEGAYFVDDTVKQILAKNLFVGHLPNPKSVGKSPQQLAQQYGFSVPDWARILVVRLNSVGRDEPLSGEKLTTVLGWYEVDGWEEGCERSLEMIAYGGRGHSQVIHARDENVIMQFGLQKPVFRIVVNTFGTLGTTGYTTGLMPSMTLGSGGVGGAITGDNITVHHMYNIKRLAYEIRTAPDAAFTPGSTDTQTQRGMFTGGADSVASGSVDSKVEEIVRKVLLELKK
ncbi:MAG TPA: aldehyde dehydrogenase family protein [Anaerolineales bacterium]|nr:aldehyde dehydrogenase family protein [Anaerolineales bacterium]HNQ96277.1 aldehyde dehydrogenase family protein [Anaerolineales bacterium]HNS62113.1 aldehyde dehydrogenase family protein [Anaerolineales bacterium]